MRLFLPATSRLLLACLAAVQLLIGCSQYQALDTLELTRKEALAKLDPELRQLFNVPFELTADLRQLIDSSISRQGGDRQKVDAILGYVFSDLDLEYAYSPTRDAAGTFAARQGNCLSFVNLFVGIGRHLGLNPFYVEVEDYQRWAVQDGVVISRGHIVAGLYIDGELSSFDFLPYRAKSYKSFTPIDDLTAMAHFFNNVGAETLMAADQDADEGRDIAQDRATQMFQIAHALAPTFTKARNNLAVARLREGKLEEATELLEAGLESAPDDIPMLTNLARCQMLRGHTTEAETLLARLDGLQRSNPFFFLFRGDQALAAGDYQAALRYMRLALAAESSLPEVQLGLLRTYLALGDIEKARLHLARALRLDPSHPDVQRYRALLATKAANRD